MDVGTHPGFSFNFDQNIQTNPTQRTLTFKLFLSVSFIFLAYMAPYFQMKDLDQPYATTSYF